MPTGTPRGVEVLPVVRGRPEGADLLTGRLYGIARIDGVWHFAATTEIQQEQVGLERNAGADGSGENYGVIDLGAGEKPIGVFPVTGGPPTYTLEVGSADVALVATADDLPWLMYADGPVVWARRLGNAGSALRGAVPTRAVIRYSGWSDVALERGPPAGVLTWWTSVDPRVAGARTWWMVPVGGERGGEPQPIGVVETGQSVDLDVFRSRAGVAALLAATSSEGVRTVRRVIGEESAMVPIASDHGYQGLYTHDGRLIIAEGRGAEEPAGLVVRDSRHGRRVLPVDGSVRGGDLALVECGGTTWLSVYTARPPEPEEVARRERRFARGLHPRRPRPDSRLLLFDLDAGSDPILLGSPDWNDKYEPALMRCAGNEVALVAALDLGERLPVYLVERYAWKW